MVSARGEVRILHLAVVDDLVPVPILTFQLIAEAHLFRRDQAKRRVVDRQIPDSRRQAQTVRRIVGFVVGGDLLDVYGGRELVQREGGTDR